MAVSLCPVPLQIPRALVVDPDADTRQRFAVTLTPVASEIEFAEDGRDALAKAIGCRPSLVITQRRLPLIDGDTLCALLRAEPLTADMLMIIVTTGEDDHAQREIARASAADSVLIKPYKPELLLEVIARGRDRGPDAQPLRTTRQATRAHKDFNVRTPSVAPRSLRCPICDSWLQYGDSHVGGVGHCVEQWDYYVCPCNCGTFQYRQRTRKLRRI